MRDAWYFGGANGCIVGDRIIWVYIPPKLIVRVTEASPGLESLGFVITQGSVSGCTGTSAVAHFQFP